ncbi:uncharacterized protein LOC111625290 [Centruroides sculpturatus]|uniref:uncharacterized protein LOC111625290 n=1 Tax=Centruroides sculpturatus TaxID=218467 RepID=UPI000C6CB084|nr:uncharacterized protein LOC111625290 [Centruroides sculpturatus]
MSSCEHANDLRTRFWEDHEVKTLLDLWSNGKVQQELDGTKRNSRVFAWLSDELCRHGILRTASQVRDKLKCLKREYRISSDKMKQCGEHERFKCKYFDELDDILSGRKTSTSTLPEITVCETIKPNEIKKEIEPQPEIIVEPSDEMEVQEPVSNVQEEVRQEQEKPAEEKVKLSKGKRSVNRIERTLTALLNHQRQIEERFLKLEEKKLLQERELMEMKLCKGEEACERWYQMKLQLKEKQWNHERQIMSMVVEAVTKRVAPTSGDKRSEIATQTDSQMEF